MAKTFPLKFNCIMIIALVLESGTLGYILRFSNGKLMSAEKALLENTYTYLLSQAYHKNSMYNTIFSRKGNPI